MPEFCGDHGHFISKINEFTDAAQKLMEAMGDLKAIREKCDNIEETQRSHTVVHQKLFDLDRERSHSIHLLELDLLKARFDLIEYKTKNDAEIVLLKRELQAHEDTQTKEQERADASARETRTSLRNPLIIGLICALAIATATLLLNLYQKQDNPSPTYNRTAPVKGQ